jgi:hypothetical protein
MSKMVPAVSVAIARLSLYKNGAFLAIFEKF